MTKLFVKDLEIGTRITGEVFLFAESSVAQSRKGSPYLKAVLADRSGRIDARYWDVPIQLAYQVQAGSGVRVDGVVEEWPPDSGERQVRIDRLQPAEILDFADFLPRAKRDLAEMRRELRQVCTSIENPHLSRLLNHIFSDQAFETAFSKAPAAKKYDHACIGGLLEHTLAVVKLCSFVADEHPDIDRDLLLTAALLHDVGNTTAYTAGPILDLTDEGKLIAHVVEGALMVEKAIDSSEGLAQDLRNRLLHAILAHHGALEQGSPVAPKTLEALALHHADWMDGDIRGFLDIVETEPISEDGWTGFARMFGTRLYAGRVQSPEEEDEQGGIPF